MLFSLSLCYLTFPAQMPPFLFSLTPISPQLPASEGRERAKAAGKHMGRKGQPDKKVQQAIELMANRRINGMSLGDIVKVTGVPKPSIYSKIKEQTKGK